MDTVGLVIIAAAACYGCFALVRRRDAQREFSFTTFVLVGAVLLAGVLTAEFLESKRRESLAAALSTLAPTYAHELQKLGHAKIRETGRPGDPTRLAVATAERDWMRLNGIARQLFTYRTNDQGQMVVVTDSGASGASGNESIAAPTASLQRALQGESLFDSTVYTDKAGSWVRYVTPIRDASGHVEAGLVLGYPADEWVRFVATARAFALGGAAFLVAVLLASATLVAVLRARIRSHADREHLLQSAKTAADEASRAKGDFLAVMSHEIRTPLNAVMGFADLLAETKLDEAQRGYLSTITSEGRRLTALINDILDLSKIEGGRLVLERLPFAPAETALEVLRLLSARALEKEIELRFEAQVAGPLLVAGDPLRFRQVLVNLVDNAIKFTSGGSVTLFLTWTPPEHGDSQGRLGVRVRDTGIGIPAEKRKDIFQMFMQADTATTRRYGGTGLGLAICQRLVTLMEGEIRVDSHHGEGSEFSFTLPATPVALPVESPATEPEEPAALPRVMRILVVDDMDTNRFLLEVFLRRNGFEPQLAAGGEEAVRLATSNTFDAILMDLQMPDVDGYMATKRIRAAEPPGRHTPIIALTASIARGTREKCLAAGMDEHLTKPIDLNKFKSFLNRLLRA